MLKKKIIAGAVGLAGLALAATIILAAAGDAVQPPIPACVGIGVAYDGTDILYTCAGDPSIHKTDLTGIPNVIVPTTDGAGNPLEVDAIAWDPNETRLWGGDLGVDPAGTPICRIWSIDMATGVGTLRFTFTDPTPLARCSVQFFDGLTVDTVTNTIYTSPDVHTHIRHFTKAGLPAANDPIDFQSLTLGQCPVAAGFGFVGCWNSGLAMGIDGNLFAGTNGDGKIFRLDPNIPASLGVFATVSGRDEDLECGPEVNGKETILSKQFQGPIDVLEAPEGTCVSPVVPQITLDPLTATNETGTTHSVTATVTRGGNPIVGTLVSFSVAVGPNNGEASDPGECAVDPNCITDPAGMTTWAYTSNGAVGTDIIVACFVDERQEKHCARVLKDWIELACRETVNPHGKTVPPAGSTTLPGPRGGQNEDGFYELRGKDPLGNPAVLFVMDLGSGMIFGPYPDGTKVKYTEAPGTTPSSKPIGSTNTNGQASAVTVHITGTGDMAVVVLDAAGNVIARDLCLVPPPPK